MAYTFYAFIIDAFLYRNSSSVLVFVVTFLHVSYSVVSVLVCGVVFFPFCVWIHSHVFVI